MWLRRRQVYDKGPTHDIGQGLSSRQGEHHGQLDKYGNRHYGYYGTKTRLSRHRSLTKQVEEQRAERAAQNRLRQGEFTSTGRTDDADIEEVQTKRLAIE